MKYCPKCREEYDDEEYSYCTFDGVALESADQISSEEAEPISVPAPSSRRSKVAPIAVAVGLIAIGALIGYTLLKRGPSQRVTVGLPGSASASVLQTSESVPTENLSPRVDITQLSDAEVLRIVPKQLLKRFRPGETGEARPEELRIFQGDGANYVVMLGTGRPGAARTALDQVLILKHKEGEFQDVTRGALPGLSGSGALGQNIHVKFDANGTDVVLRRPASSRAIVDECPLCEHAYQQVTLQWKGSHFAEKQREWDNDRYTAFYVAAEALERRRVDKLARPLIDHPLDALIAEGFERPSKRGWVVENLTDDQDAPAADYELKNGTDRIVIRVAKQDGKWKATRIISR